MNLKPEILRLAVPSILANITVPLVGMVDIAVVGHLGTAGSGFTGAALIGGISIGTMLFDLLYWNFAFLRAGTGGLTAQAYGRRESMAAIGRILSRALHIALLSALALILLQWVVVKAAFLFVECSTEVQQLATRYFYIRIWAAPATLSLFAFKGWFIGLQDSVRPMTADLLVNVINMVLSVALGFGLPGLPALGFSGVALGTVIAQWSGFAYCLVAARHRYGFSISRNSLSVSFLNKRSIKKRSISFAETTDNQKVIKHEKTQADGTAGFFSLNRDLFLRSLGMIAVYIGFTVLSARFGDLALAVSTILMKLLMVFSYFTDGFAYAGEALTGRFIGEHSTDGVRSTVRDTYLLTIGVMLLFMLGYGLGGTPLFRLMTSDTAVVEAGRAYLPWLLLMPLIGCPAFVWDGIFIGATASKDLRNSTLLCALGFFSTWFILCGVSGSSPEPERALHYLMAAYFVHLAIRSGYLTAKYRNAVLGKLLP